ncbi:MAG: FMN-binding glutamate synthase family protein, partial [Gammaproteobacteria bacterium]
IQQYFIDSNNEAFPFESEIRSLLYLRSIKELDTVPFGTQRDVYRTGYEWASHSVGAQHPLKHAPRIEIGGPRCSQKYSASLLNISAMSFGALSGNAILALNRGAKFGQFAHNTGEGGISTYHLEHGGDLIWQIGTGYFGCRNSNGSFSEQLFTVHSNLKSVKMIEIKLSQGAKPGHGGVLPGVKVTNEIAEARGVSPYQTVISPPQHSAFSTPIEMMEFIQLLREKSGGKPIGIKLCVGRRGDLFSMCKAMIKTDIYPDFITVDGGEGGTGAAPLEFSNSIGMPARDAWILVHNILVGLGLREHIKIIASGKILTGFHIVRALSLGADLCSSARGMMFALGCIQSLRCNTNHCPTGITTQNPALSYGLDITNKANRVLNFHAGTLQSVLEIIGV